VNLMSKGRQLFTGSFHPIEDREWENRAAWDKRVAPTEAVTLREIFERRAIIRVATLKRNAIKILSRFTPYLGQDLCKIIVELLSGRDCCTLSAVCRVDEVRKPEETVIVTNVPLPVPASSIMLDNSIFFMEAEKKDLFSNDFRELNMQVHQVDDFSILTTLVHNFFLHIAKQSLKQQIKFFIRFFIGSLKLLPVFHLQ
jgi:hypothetical protein